MSDFSPTGNQASGVTGIQGQQAGSDPSQQSDPIGDGQGIASSASDSSGMSSFFDPSVPVNQDDPVLQESNYDPFAITPPTQFDDLENPFQPVYEEPLRQGTSQFDDISNVSPEPPSIISPGAPERGPITTSQETRVEPTAEMGQEGLASPEITETSSEQGKEEMTQPETISSPLPIKPKSKKRKKKRVREEELDPVSRMYGYKVSKQLAAKRKDYSKMSGKGNISLSKTWLIMLLDRLLKVEAEKEKGGSK